MFGFAIDNALEIFFISNLGHFQGLLKIDLLKHVQVDWIWDIFVKKKNIFCAFLFFNFEQIIEEGGQGAGYFGVFGLRMAIYFHLKFWIFFIIFSPPIEEWSVPSIHFHMGTNNIKFQLSKKKKNKKDIRQNSVSVTVHLR